MRYLSLIILLLPLEVMAQQLEFQAEVGAGYEYNVFNAGPKQMVTTGDRMHSALQSGAFLYEDLRLGWNREGEKGELKIGVRAQYDYYPRVRAANLVRPGADLAYRYHPDKNTRIYTELRYRDFQTERGADPNEVLVIPTSYRTWEGLAGYAWRPAKDTWLRLEVHGKNKRFAAASTRQLQYNRLGIRAEWKQRFRAKGKPSSYLVTRIDVNRRRYVEEGLDLLEGAETESEEEPEPADDNERLWRYQQIDITYRFRKSNHWQLEAGVGFLNRADIIQERLGYRQGSVFSRLRYNQGSWSLSWSTSYLYRPYIQFAAVAGGDEMLLHTYWRNSLLATYNLSKDWQIILRGTTVKRWRNEAEQASNFLPYFNSLVRMGLRWKLGSK